MEKCISIQIIDSARKLADNDCRIDSVILVGSYARGAETVDSDIDFVIITACKDELLKDESFIKAFGEVKECRIEYYGACTSLRVWYDSGAEVEFGFVRPSWISLPLEEGTDAVLKGGWKVLNDKKGYFNKINIAPPV